MECVSEMGVYIEFHFRRTAASHLRRKPDLEMMSQLTFQRSSHNVGKQDGDVHENYSCPCFVQIFKKNLLEKHVSTTTFKHGKQRGNMNRK